MDFRAVLGKARLRRTASAAAGVILGVVLFGATPAFAVTDPGGSIPDVVSSTAKANVGKGDCSTNSLGGKGYYTSCTNHEYWCADFAKWVWVKSGVAGSNTSSLTASAYSFYSWSKNHSRFSTQPALGAIAIFSNNKGDTSHSSSGINHVAVVSAVSGTSVKLVSGDWGGTGSTMRAFADSSKVVKNDSGDWLNGKVGAQPATMGMYVIGYALT